MANRRLTAGALIVGSVASLSTLFALGAGSLGAFNASITNDTNTAGTGTLVMLEKNADGSVTCSSSSGTNNAATCSTINKYGGNLQMSPTSAPVATTISIANTGNLAAGSFTLTPSACTQTNNPSASPAGTATDLCAHLNVVITQDGKQIYSGTAAGLSSAITLTPLAAGATSQFVFTTSIDSAVGNTYQGLMASQPLQWTFAQ